MHSGKDDVELCSETEVRAEADSVGEPLDVRLRLGW